MGLHKLTPGDGYTYLTRQVAAHDRTERGHTGLADYYDEKGESPGRWIGAGLTGLGLSPGDLVAEEQMRALFGEGRHPNSESHRGRGARRRRDAVEAEAAAALGRAFQVYAGAPPLRVEWAKAFTAYNTDRGLRWDTPLPAAERARIRTETATRLFTEQHGRAPLDGRELDGFIARESRQATTAVAGYDLTFSPVKSVSALWAVAPPRSPARSRRRTTPRSPTRSPGWSARRRSPGSAGPAPGRSRSAAWSPPRSPTATPAPATPTCTPTSRSATRCRNARPAAGSRWTAGCSTRRTSPPPSATTPASKPSWSPASGSGSPNAQTPTGKRPVREIDGVDPLLAQVLVATAAQRCEKRYAELAVDFSADHGRPPTAVEALALKQRATLETRDAKHEPRSEAEQRAALGRLRHAWCSATTPPSLPWSTGLGRSRAGHYAEPCLGQGDRRPRRREPRSLAGDLAGLARPSRGGASGPRRRRAPEPARRHSRPGRRREP